MDHPVQPCDLDFGTKSVGQRHPTMQHDIIIKRLPARVNKIGKIESRGKVLKLSDKSNKLNLTRPFTAREKNRLVI